MNCSHQVSLRRTRSRPEGAFSQRLSVGCEPGGPIAGKLMALIERAQRQQTGIAGDLATGEVSQNRLMTVEGEAELLQNTLYQAMDAPKGNDGWRNPVFINFLENPLFFG